MLTVEETCYLIVGGALAGGSAIEGIRERDHEGRIVLVSHERHLPHDRVPLSKGYMMGKLSRESLFLHRMCDGTREREMTRADVDTLKNYPEPILRHHIFVEENA